MYIKSLAVFILLLETTIGRVNKSCKNDSDCPANARCQNGKVCFCNDGYIDEIIVTLRCLKEATKYNDFCEQDIQCQGLLGLRAHCHHGNPNDTIGKCVCNSDSHYKENICHPNAYIGDKCVVSSDCIIMNRDLQAYCYEGKCVCPPKHIPSTDRKNCLPAAGLGEKCDPNVICVVNNSHCDEICSCKMGYVVSKDVKQCLLSADKIGDPCKEDSQCIDFLKLSKCNLEKKQCECENYAHRLDNECWLTVELNGLCDYDAECITAEDRSRVECRAGSCECRNGFNQVKNTCRSKLIAEAGFTTGSSSKINISYQNILSFVLFVIYIRPFYS